MVHGDDFVTVGSKEDIQWMKEQVDKRFELKTEMIGKNFET